MNYDTLSQEEIDKTHEGFVVTCKKCNSTRVIFESSLGFSSVSGSWGSADLTCLDCNTSVELIST